MADPVTHQIPWLRVLVEGVVIVGSILLAFGLQAWWDETQERVEEQRVLAALRVDITATQSELERFVGLHEESLEATNTFLWLVQGGSQMPTFDQLGEPADFYLRFALPVSVTRPGEATWKVTVPDPVIGPVLNTLTFDPVTANLDLLLASGDLMILSDVKLRKELATLPAEFADARDDEQIVEDFVFQQLIPLLSRSGNLIRPHLFRRFWSGLPDEALEGLSEVEASTELSNMLASRSSLEAHAVDQLQDVGKRLNELLEVIDAAIN